MQNDRVKIPQKIYFKFLLLTVLLIGKQTLSGQNIILIEGKYNDKKYFLTEGKKVFIETTNNKKIRGKITEITDHSIIINEAETDIGNIKNIKFRIQNGWKTAGGITSTCFGLTALPGTILFIKLYVIFPNNLSPPPPQPGIVPFGRIVVITVMSSIGAGVYYGLFHKKFFDMKFEYDMKVVREENH